MKTLETYLSGWFDGRFSKRFVTLICLSFPLLANGQSLLHGPDGYELLPNMPNPFNPSTLIRYQVSGAHGGTPLRLAVYDVLGREVAVLVDGVMPAGEHLTRFDASRLPSGMYIAVLESGGQRRFRSMMLIK